MENLVGFGQCLWDGGKVGWFAYLKAEFSVESLKPVFSYYFVSLNSFLISFFTLIAYTRLGLLSFWIVSPRKLLITCIFELFWQLNRNERKPIVDVLDVQSSKDCSAECDTGELGGFLGHKELCFKHAFSQCIS